MLTLSTQGKRTVVWLAASLTLLLILILITPRLLPKQSDENPTLTPLASVNSSPTSPLNVPPLHGESIQYAVAEGESLFDIAEKFDLKPETILWVNPDKLADNPDNIKPNMVLRIPSVDGLYYRWKAGDKIEAIASRYGADTNDILNWSENIAQIEPAENPNIQPGTLLFIPGGKMPFQLMPTLPSINTPTP
jgi:LysM repeat protein